MKDIVINGKVYSMWQQFVHQQKEWIGGTLEDFGDSMDRGMGALPIKTIITGIVLRENGKDSAYFEVNGKDYGCGSDVKYIGITAGDEGWITLSGYSGHKWRIKKMQ